MKNVLAIVVCALLISCSSSSDETTPTKKVTPVIGQPNNNDNTGGKDTNDTNNPSNEDQNNLDPKLSPSENFNLSTWKLQIPIDTNGDNIGDEIKVTELNNKYTNKDHFYTSKDGGIVFKCFVKGFKTSQNTKFTRSELREMLRGTNTSISTKGVNKNNWVFSGAPASDKEKAGAIGGVLKATLAVNHVTTTGDQSQVGRVVIGQIHANDDEPIRLYYRKLPNNSKGAIYFAHEINGGSDEYYNIIGTRSSSLSNPEDGIALNEKFSYIIDVTGDILTVTLSRKNKNDIVKTVDMKDSGYNNGGQYMYFKAGVYIQDSTGDDTDYTQATFYNLENTH